MRYAENEAFKDFWVVGSIHKSMNFVAFVIKTLNLVNNMKFLLRNGN